MVYSAFSRKQGICLYLFFFFYPIISGEKKVKLEVTGLVTIKATQTNNYMKFTVFFILSSNLLIKYLPFFKSFYKFVIVLIIKLNK